MFCVWEDVAHLSAFIVDFGALECLDWSGLFAHLPPGVIKACSYPVGQGWTTEY